MEPYLCFYQLGSPSAQVCVMNHTFKLLEIMVMLLQRFLADFKFLQNKREQGARGQRPAKPHFELESCNSDIFSLLFQIKSLNQPSSSFCTLLDIAKGSSVGGTVIWVDSF